MLPPSSSKVLIADDEPFYQEWLSDFLESKGVEVEYAYTVDEAVEKLLATRYRIVIVDLNIPMEAGEGSYSKKISGTYDKYPGLYIAHAARNAQYRSRQVIIYSVFSSKEIEGSAEKIYCTYLTKMQPDDLRAEINHVLSYDPTADSR